MMVRQTENLLLGQAFNAKPTRIVQAGRSW